MSDESVTRWMPAASVAVVLLFASANALRVGKRLGYSPVVIWRHGTRAEKVRSALALPGALSIAATSFAPGLLGPRLASPFDPALRAAGFALWIGGAAVVLASFRKLGTSWRIGVDPDAPSALVTSGVYGVVRHPIYAGFLAWFLGLLALLPSLFFLATAAIGYALVRAQALREERFLREVHPAAYADYARRVGRFFPRLGRRR